MQVSVRILGGLMALGYEIGTMLKRSSQVYFDETLTIKIDEIEGMDRQYVQIQGKDRAAVGEAGRRLGLEGTYIARSYIEQVKARLESRPDVICARAVVRFPFCSFLPLSNIFLACFPLLSCLSPVFSMSVLFVISRVCSFLQSLLIICLLSIIASS